MDVFEAEDVSFRDSYYYTNHVFSYNTPSSLGGKVIASLPHSNVATAASKPSFKTEQNQLNKAVTRQRKDTSKSGFFDDLAAVRSLARQPSTSTVKTVELTDWTAFARERKAIKLLAKSKTKNEEGLRNAGGFGVAPLFRAEKSQARTQGKRTTISRNVLKENFESLSLQDVEDVDDFRGYTSDEAGNNLAIRSTDNLFTPSFSIRHKCALKRPPQFLHSRNGATKATTEISANTVSTFSHYQFHSKVTPIKSPSTPAKSTPNRAAEWRKARIGKLQQFRKARQEAPDPEMLEPPAEKDYETRPMSAHTRFLLSDYIKPSGMVVEGEEPDDFEKRMRTLFLPSLFAGDAPDDFKNNSAKGRRFPTLSRGGTSNRSAASGRGQSPQATPKGETGTSRRTVSFKEAANSGDDSGKEGAIQEVKVDHRRQSQAKPPLNVTKTPPRPSSANRRPDSSDMRRRLFMPPPPTKRPTSATSASSLRTRLSFQVASTQLVNNNVSGGIAPNSSDNLPQIRRTPSARSRSAKLRQRRLSTNFHKHVPIKQAQLQTMSAGADENPSDLHLPLLRWEVAIYGVLQHIKLKQALSEDRVRTPGSASVEMMQRAKRDKMDVIGALRVKRIYDIFVGSREDKDLDVLDSILGKYLCFAKLSPVVRYKLYNCCTLETHPRGTVVIREGFQARFWYVLLTGECLHQLRPDTPMTVTTRVGVGGSVGEFNNLYGSGSTNETRHVRATCLMRCDFLRIEKSDYLAISREAKGLDTMVFEFFSTVPAFFGVERQVLNSLCQRSIVRKFDADQVVLRAGEPCANVYFIIKGKIRALHMVTFVKIDAGYLRDTKIDRRHKYTLTPQTLTSRLGPSDEVVRELATVLDLTQGMSFPPMKMSRVIQEQMEADSGRRGSLGIVLPPGRMDPHSNPCPFHFVVVDRLEVVAVGMRDLVDILPPETLRRVMEQRSLTDVSSQEIEERFLAAQGWRNSGLDGNMSLRIMDTGFINNSSWSNPVVKGKFKKLAQEEEEREALMTATTTQAE